MTLPTLGSFPVPPTPSPTRSVVHEDAASGTRDMLGLFGQGRSGTTWLGCILDAHPEVTYRFEPHHKTPSLSKDSVAACLKLRDEDLSDSDLPSIRAELLKSNPYSDKPPFFEKAEGSLRMPGLRQMLCPIARQLAPFRPIYRRLFTPRGDTTLVFKLVAHERECRRLIVQTSLPIVYLVRHPCGVVNSVLKGQSRGLMPSGRRSIIRQLLLDNAPHLHERFANTLETMSPPQLEAVLWMFGVEWAYGVERRPRAGVHLLFYENLCRDPRAQVEPAFGLIGRELHDNVVAFIDASTSGEKRQFSELGIGRYFSVFRDPNKSMNAWRETMTSEDRRAVLDIVRDCAMFTWGVEEADWDH